MSELKSSRECEKKFYEICQYYLGDREGVHELNNYLIKETDFFYCPASTRYHEAYDYGLLEHTIKVWDALSTLCDNFNYFNMESATLVALYHDICKANCYKKEWRNVKTYDEAEVNAMPEWARKSDPGGTFVWVTKEQYSFDDSFPLGHGEKSVYLVERFVRLTQEEALSIRYHMGAWEDGDKRGLSKAFELYKLPALLHTADTLATYM